MPTGEERRGAVCGRTACTVRCGGGRKPGQSASPRGPGASRRPYRHPETAFPLVAYLATIGPLPLRWLEDRKAQGLGLDTAAIRRLTKDSPVRPEGRTLRVGLAR